MNRIVTIGLQYLVNLLFKVGKSKSYVAKFYDNGTEVFDQSGVWSIRNQDHSTAVMASITASTGNSATVKAGLIVHISMNLSY